MSGEELKKQIENLEMLISTETENYKTALQSQLPHEILFEMRANIKKLRTNLKVLLDQQSVEKTGDLPGGGVS
jgi:glutamyl-tRNA reductase